MKAVGVTGAGLYGHACSTSANQSPRPDGVVVDVMATSVQRLRPAAAVRGPSHRSDRSELKGKTTMDGHQRCLGVGREEPARPLR